jgi:flap endonuclease-1
MGVNLTPIIVKRDLDLRDLRGRVLAVDAPGELYQFLALIRFPGGVPLKDSRGNITSHLAGLLYRTTRVVGEHGPRLVFVFDGKPPELKGATLARRQAVKERYQREHVEAVASGDAARAFRTSTMTSRISRSMLRDAQRLLGLLGIPWLTAPGEAEAQAASMAVRGDAWAVVSKDYDSLVLGAPRLIRFLAVQSRQFQPSKGASRPVPAELIDLEEMLLLQRLDQAGLVDLAILIGTDFNEGVRGIGPKSALRLIQEHGAIERLPDAVRERVSPDYPRIREIYLKPQVTASYRLEWAPPDEAGVEEFLCSERSFDRQRVRRALLRMKSAGSPKGS